MVAIVPAVTGFVVTMNVAVVAPAATVTDGSTVAALVLLLFNATTAPPAGAAALSVTVPVLFAPPVSVAGFSVIEARAASTCACKADVVGLINAKTVASIVSRTRVFICVFALIRRKDG